MLFFTRKQLIIYAVVGTAFGLSALALTPRASVPEVQRTSQEIGRIQDSAGNTLILRQEEDGNLTDVTIPASNKRLHGI